MFDSFKKKTAGWMLVKGFESDLNGIKKASIDDQKWVVEKILSDCEALEDITDLGVLSDLLRCKSNEAKERRHAALMAGSQNEQNKYYAEATLCEARHLAQLGGDGAVFDAVNGPLITWMMSLAPLIRADKDSKVSAGVETKTPAQERKIVMPPPAPPKPMHGDAICPKCKKTDAISNFQNSAAGSFYRRCYGCGTNFQIQS
jgi:hypothetical protein